MTGGESFPCEMLPAEKSGHSSQENNFAHKFWIELNINEGNILSVQIHFECALVMIR